KPFTPNSWTDASMVGLSEPSESSRRCIACDRAGPFPLLFERGSLRLVRCPSCGLAFQHPLPDPSVLENTFYQDATFSDELFGSLRETTLRRAQAKLPLLERVGVRRGGKLLDVGASSGAWLEVAASVGWHGIGVEPALETAKRARDRGLDIRTGTI